MNADQTASRCLATAQSAATDDTSRSDRAIGRKQQAILTRPCPKPVVCVNHGIAKLHPSNCTAIRPQVNGECLILVAWPEQCSGWRTGSCLLCSRWIDLSELVFRGRPFALGFALRLAHASEPREGRRILAHGEAEAEPWGVGPKNDVSPRRGRRNHWPIRVTRPTCLPSPPSGVHLRLASCSHGSLRSSAGRRTRGRHARWALRM